MTFKSNYFAKLSKNALRPLLQVWEQFLVTWQNYSFAKSSKIAFRPLLQVYEQLLRTFKNCSFAKSSKIAFRPLLQIWEQILMNWQNNLAKSSKMLMTLRTLPHSIVRSESKLLLKWSLKHHWVISFRPDVDDDCDDVKGGRNWWSRCRRLTDFLLSWLIFHVWIAITIRIVMKMVVVIMIHDDYDEYIFLRLASLLLPVFY